MFNLKNNICYNSNMNISKKIIYAFSIIYTFIFSFFSLFYYAFSGGSETKEYFTGILLLLISVIFVIAIFFIKHRQKTAGTIFILSGLSAIVVISVFIGNPFILFTKSIVGIILTTIPIILITTGVVVIKYKII